MTDQEKLFHEAVETMLTMYKKLGLDPSTNGLFWANSELTRLRSENEGLRKTNSHLHKELKRVKEALKEACRWIAGGCDPVVIENATRAINAILYPDRRAGIEGGG